MICKKIMATEDGAAITSLSYDKWRGMVYAFSGSGDTYSIESIPESFGKYGPSIVFSSIYDGDGNASPVVSFGAVYEIYDAVISANQNSYTVYRQVGAYAAESPRKVYGRYVSEVLASGPGFGFWKDISWLQSTPGNSIVSIYIKVADSYEAVAEAPWAMKLSMEESYQYGNRISYPLDRFNLVGRFMMFMVEFETDAPTDVPYTADMAVSYVGSHSAYFFSDAIRVESGYPDNLILTASVSNTRKTEITFGIGPGGSADWKDYVPVDLDRIVSIPKSFGRRFKVGARMSSYDIVDSPVIHEFALSFGAPTNNEVNL